MRFISSTQHAPQRSRALRASSRALSSLEQLLSVHVHVQRRGEAQGKPSRGFGEHPEGLELLILSVVEGFHRGTHMALCKRFLAFVLDVAAFDEGEQALVHLCGR